MSLLRMRIGKSFLLLSLLTAIDAKASYIETTMGTAVVNDATAAYYNPAALMLLKTPQLIPLLSVSRFNTEFSGSTTAVPTGLVESGTSNSTSHYYSPSFYVGVPINPRITVGVAVVSNFANRNPEEGSILRYMQSSNTIQDYDYVPSIGLRLNPYLSIGGGINFSYVNFNLHPTIGFPGSNVPDSQANNRSDGTGVGGNIGFLLQPRPGTLIGFNYRTLTTYQLSGTSRLNDFPTFQTDGYHYKLRTPSRGIFSISQRLTESTGVIATIQRINWSITRHINIYNAATIVSGVPIQASASVPYYLHNSWVFTLGGNYRFNPTWIIRAAATYYQSPHNGFYQLGTGNTYLVGASLGYNVNKSLILDVGYAHSFIQPQSIDITGNRFLINGHDNGSRDAVSLKATFNV